MLTLRIGCPGTTRASRVEGLEALHSVWVCVGVSLSLYIYICCYRVSYLAVVGMIGLGGLQALS